MGINKFLPLTFKYSCKYSDFPFCTFAIIITLELGENLC